MKIKTIFKVLVGIITFIILAIVIFVAFLTITEYHPQPLQKAEHEQLQADDPLTSNEMCIYTWNIGYAGLGAETDFFMDGGSNVNPSDEELDTNLAAIKKFISENEADAWMLQEVDTNSARSNKVNQLTSIAQVYQGSYGLAYNYKCAFVPIPFPPIGQMESGIATFTNLKVNDHMQRISLPCPFSWPVSSANLKRCLLVTRIDLANSDKEVVLVNLHLEAYDDGEGKIAQTKQLMQLLQDEYAKGNYVIAGGDFNQIFPNSLDKYPLDESLWMPGVLNEADLGQGFKYAYDNNATCRLLNEALNDNTQKYVIDGFIVSPNVEVKKVKTIDLGFENSDHNPVKLQISLVEE